MFGTDFYVRITRNLFRVKNLKSGREAQGRPDAPFTTTRLLVGNFEPAARALKSALEEVDGTSFLAMPNLLMHPLELVEGGLSEIEERVLRELALGSGAKKAVVWLGAELTDSQVSARLSGR